MQQLSASVGMHNWQTSYSSEPRFSAKMTTCRFYLNTGGDSEFMKYGEERQALSKAFTCTSTLNNYTDHVTHVGTQTTWKTA